MPSRSQSSVLTRPATFSPGAGLQQAQCNSRCLRDPGCLEACSEPQARAAWAWVSMPSGAGQARMPHTQASGQKQGRARHALWTQRPGDTRASLQLSLTVESVPRILLPRCRWGAFKSEPCSLGHRAAHRAPHLSPQLLQGPLSSLQSKGQGQRAAERRRPVPYGTL